MKLIFLGRIRMLPLALCVSALIGLAGCSGGSVKYSIDNPTAQPVAVTIDGKSIEVAAHSDSTLALKAGEHTLAAPATGPIRFIVYADGAGGVLNPTLSTYVVVNEVYATNDTTAQGFQPMASPIVINGVTVNGPFVLYSDLFIEKNWSYGVHEDFPRKITVSNDSTGNIKGKIFTKEDFIRFFEERENQKGRFAKEGTPPPASIWRAPKPAELPHFKDAQLDATAEKARVLLNRYRGAKDAAEQRQLRKDSHTIVLELVQVFASKASSLGQAENQKYNDFVQTFGTEFGRSVQILP